VVTFGEVLLDFSEDKTRAEKAEFKIDRGISLI